MERDYHDYFIKDGRHIGRYEEMYQNCSDPWRIEEIGPRLDMRAALLLLEGREGRIGRFLDVGAGLGLFTGLLTEALWRVNPEIRGLVTDISPAAVDKAARRLADDRLEFQPLDVRGLAESRLLPLAGFDLIVMAQVLWGLLENLSDTLTALAGLLPPGGMMLISQHFFPPGGQGYGAEVVSSPDDLSAHLDRVGLEVAVTLETNRRTNHHWAALAERRA